MQRNVDTQGEKDIQYLMKLAINQGVESIYQNHPIFRGSEKFLLKHIDSKNLRNKAEEIYSGLLKNNIRGERAREYIEKELADYIKSGEFFDEKGKEIIGKGAIKEKQGFLEKIVSFFNQKSEGEKELNDTMHTLQDLYLFYKSGNYEKSIPELNKSFQDVEKYLTKLEKGNFVPVAANIFEAYGKINKKIADSWRKYGQNYKEKTKEGEEHIKEIKSGIERYIVPQKVAASIIGFVGIMLIIFNLNITGAVIGENYPITIGIIGVFMIFFALLLFFRPLKKKL